MNNIKKYSAFVLLSLGLLLVPGAQTYAFFADYAITHEMQSYLYETLERESHLLAEQYNTHVADFQQKRKQEIQNQLDQKREEWNKDTDALQDEIKELNQKIASYNKLLVQLNSVERPQKTLRRALSTVVDIFNRGIDLKKQIALTVGEMNYINDVLNNLIKRLNVFEQWEHAVSSFYHNREYERGTFVQFIDELNSWITAQNKILDTVSMEHNNTVAQFEQWVRHRQSAILFQRHIVLEQRQELENSTSALNALIEQYNREIQTPCPKTPAQSSTQNTNPAEPALSCEQSRQNMKNQIEMQKQEVLTKQTALDSLIFNINQQEMEFNRQIDKQMREFNVAKDEIDQMFLSISAEKKQRADVLAHELATAEMQAKADWEHALSELKRFRRQNIEQDYGTKFTILTGVIHDWVSIFQQAWDEIKRENVQVSLDTMALLEAIDHLLCKYSTEAVETTRYVCEDGTANPSSNLVCEYKPGISAQKVKAMCEISNRTYSLLRDYNNNLNMNSADMPRAVANLLMDYTDENGMIYLEELKADWEVQESEIESLRREVEERGQENEEIKNRIASRTEEHNQLIEERRQQLAQMDAQLTQELRTQLSLIYQVYETKRKLLIEEYKALSYLMFHLEKDTAPSPSVWKDFQTLREQLIAGFPVDIPGFAPDFTNTTAIIAEVFNKQDDGDSDRDTEVYTAVDFSPHAPTDFEDYVRPVEEDEKRQVVFAWKNTPVVKRLLEVIVGLMKEAPDALQIFSYYQDKTSGSAGTLNPPPGQNNITMDFVATLFLESVYHLTPIEQVMEENLIRYQIKFDNRNFLIAEDGDLSAPAGYYQ